jgi:hypothetical protein
MRLSGGSTSEDHNISTSQQMSPMQVYSFGSWDWITGAGKRMNDDNTLFTVFRNRITKVAVEFVHDDHITCFGFFRFFSSDIFLFEPEMPIFANFSAHCPGFCCFVNGHYTGDFLMAPNLYHYLSTECEGSHLACEIGDVFNVYHWNVSLKADRIFISRPDCAPARLVLIDHGFVYEGAPDRYNFVRNPPSGLILEGCEPPRKLELEEASKLINDAL